MDLFAQRAKAVTQPPSGVSGMTPLQVRTQMLRNGWSVLPIALHDAGGKGAGKRPSIRGWQTFAAFDANSPGLDQVQLWNQNQAPGTGIACGNVVAIDLDFSDQALVRELHAIAVEVLGDTPFVRQGAAPKVALIYHAAEAIESLALKAADGCGDGIDIQADGRQLVAYGIHPKTLRPYRWIGETPLTAPPDAAPAVTRAQIAAFLARVGELVELNKSGGRKGRKGGDGQAQIVRNDEGRVVDGRELHLTRTVYRSAREMHRDGAELAEAALTERSWHAFAATTVLEGGKWTRTDARRKAAALLDRLRRGLVAFEPEIKAAEPSYPDTRRDLHVAQEVVSATVGAFFGEHVPAWRQAVIADKEAVPTSWAVRVETAIGKTEIAIQAAAAAAKAGMPVIYAVPTHRLGAELVTRFKAEGVSAHVYRGYEADDPGRKGKAMCLDLAAVQDAKEVSAGSIKDLVCENKDTPNGTVHCRFFSRCGMTRQREAEPTVWLVPHALLLHERPSFIPKPAAIVIDESFVAGAIPDTASQFSLDAMERSDCRPPVSSLPFLDDIDTNELKAYRADLICALRAHHEDGPLQRAILAKHGVTAATAAKARGIERTRACIPADMVPGMPAGQRRKLATSAGRRNKEVWAWVGIWDELQTFLEGDADASGRLSLRYDEETACRSVERRSLSTVADSWRAPALLLDATLPEPILLEPVLGHAVEIKADVAARWSPHGRVRQIIGAPVSATKLGIARDREVEGDRRVVGDLLRFIRLRAALVPERVVAVIGQKALIEKLTAVGLPPNVEVGHFGAVAGLDRWRDAAGLICIGRLLPDPRTMEVNAGCITGRVPERVTSETGFLWYARHPGGLRLASGEGVVVEHCRHPDPVAEALRWQACEANLIQAIGRLRPLRRGRDAPFFLDIITDVPLPIVVDEVATWESACPGRWADMAVEGVLLSSLTHAQAALPGLAPTREAARWLVADLTRGVTSIGDLLIDVTPRVEAVEYKTKGHGRPAIAYVLPNGPSDFRRWLEARLGPVDWIRVANGPSACELTSDETSAPEHEVDGRGPAEAPPLEEPEAQAAEDQSRCSSLQRLSSQAHSRRHQGTGRASPWPP